VIVARVAKKFKFDGAHFLPHYPGKCKDMHGHTWYLEIEVRGPVKEKGPYQGMVVDFSEMRKWVEPELNAYDHKVLNDVLLNPTAENIAAYMYKSIVDWNCNKYLGEGVDLISVTVWESPDSFAKVTAEDQDFVSVMPVLRVLEEDEAPPDYPKVDEGLNMEAEREAHFNV